VQSLPLLARTFISETSWRVPSHSACAPIADIVWRVRNITVQFDASVVGSTALLQHFGECRSSLVHRVLRGTAVNLR
jgi:hypothetical protein